MDTGTTSLSIDGRTVIQVESPAVAREEDIANRIPAFEGFTEALSKIATSVRAGLAEVEPSRATVEFGVDVSMEAGQATALIVKGTGAAHVTVTLEWDLR